MIAPSARRDGQSGRPERVGLSNDFHRQVSLDAISLTAGAVLWWQTEQFVTGWPCRRRPRDSSATSGSMARLAGVA
jgi:hypothetical protein